MAELPQDSTALSTLGTVGEDRAASRPPFSASGGSSSASLASLRLPDLRGARGPGRKSGCHRHWLLTLESEMFNPSVSLLWPGLGNHRPLGALSLFLTKRTREVGGRLVGKPISQTGTLRLWEGCTTHPRSHGE